MPGRSAATRTAPSRRAGAWLWPLNLMGVNHGIQRQRCSSRSVEQGQDRRSKDTVQAQGHLGASCSPADGKPGARARPLQLGNRQRAARVRPRQPQGSGHLPRRPRGHPCLGDSARYAVSVVVRDRTGHARGRAEVDQASRAAVPMLPPVASRQEITRLVSVRWILGSRIPPVSGVQRPCTSS